MRRHQLNSKPFGSEHLEAIIEAIIEAITEVMNALGPQPERRRRSPSASCECQEPSDGGRRR